jgi:hypothetical protein
MTSIRTVVVAVFALAVASSAHAQDFAGTYTLAGAGDAATLVIERSSDGAYTGRLSSDEFEVALSGETVDGILQGVVDDGTESIVFFAEADDSNLMLSLAQLDAFGQPMLASAQILLFDRSAAQAARAAQPGGTGEVVVNARRLGEEELAALEQAYGVAPLPGEYWYDTSSGLYGVVGYQAFGFMFPGHDLGPLARDASAGDTNVLINGRELPQSEWLIWSYMLGTAIQVGSYWLDAQGNAGYEGSPIPLVNLYVAAQQNAYSGQGGSGDNFWSTRFSAGNSDSDNSRGYVSVPGYGPVGYGF